MDYKESTVDGNKWRRAYRIEISNKHKQLPSIQFVEQDIISFGNEFVENHVGTLDIVFNENNPLHLQAYSILNSIYEEERVKRDNLLIVEEVII